jgi:hypothetical protein
MIASCGIVHLLHLQGLHDIIARVYSNLTDVRDEFSVNDLHWFLVPHVFKFDLLFKFLQLCLLLHLLPLSRLLELQLGTLIVTAQLSLLE